MKENVFSLGERKRDQCPPECSSVQGLQRTSNNENQPVPLPSAAQPGGPAPRRSQGPARPGRDPSEAPSTALRVPRPEGRTDTRPALAKRSRPLSSAPRAGTATHRRGPTCRCPPPGPARLPSMSLLRSAPPRPRDWRRAAGRSGPLAADRPAPRGRPPFPQLDGDLRPRRPPAPDPPKQGPPCPASPRLSRAIGHRRALGLSSMAAPSSAGSCEDFAEFQVAALRGARCRAA